MALVPKIISLHPKLAGVLDLLVGALFLWWMQGIRSFAIFGAWMLLRAAWWLALFQVMYYPPPQTYRRHWWSLVCFEIGAGSLLVLSDAPALRQMVALGYLLAPLASFWLVPVQQSALSHVHKPLRRVLLLMCAAGVAGWWSFFLALPQIQLVPRAWWWVAGAVAALATGWLSLWWWKNYGESDRVRAARAAAAIVIVTSEAAYALSLWPIGYLAGGLLVGWIWYLLWLLLRFYLSPEGIHWRRQAPFLMVNAALMAGYIGLLVRWK